MTFNYSLKYQEEQVARGYFYFICPPPIKKCGHPDPDAKNTFRQHLISEVIR